MPNKILDKIFNGKEIFELKIGFKIYLFNIVKINEFNFFLMYGTDITDTKDKEKILQKLSKYFSPQVYSSIFSGQLDVTINTSRSITASLCSPVREASMIYSRSFKTKKK